MKESGAFGVLELSEAVHTAHDDKLLIRGQKHEVGLTADWRSMTEIRRADDKPVIVSYVKRNSNPVVAIAPDAYAELPPADKESYAAQPLRGLDLGEGSTVELRDNRVDLRMLGLWDSFGSRYRMALDAMVKLVEQGVLKYSPRAPETERNLREALRNRLRRTMKPTEYEHDILLRGAIGRAVWADVRDSGKAKVVGGTTAYVAGFNRYDGIKTAVKVYDVGAREGLPGGQFFKVETTLFKAYFKTSGIGIRELTEQPEIQERLLDKLTQDVGNVIRLCRGETVEALQTELQLSGGGKVDRRHAEIASALLHRDDTLTGRVARLERDFEAMRREQADVKRRLERIEREATRNAISPV